MDNIFGYDNFLNDISWCYKTREMSKKYWNRKHDHILLYSKTKKYKFNWEEVLTPLSEATVKKYKYKDDKGRYRLVGRGIKGSPIRSQKDVSPELVTRSYLKKGYPPEDYWYIDIINQAAKERIGDSVKFTLV